MSGLVNAHTHLYSGLAPLGMPAPEPTPETFVQILERVWWRLDRALDARALRASARFAVADGLLSGTTVLFDHHESPNFIEGSLDVVADACQELGMRALVCYGATERNAGRDEARRGLDECRRFIRTNRRPLVRGAVGLHASFTVSDETIREAADLCRELGAVLHTHLAEAIADVEDATARGYDGPLERLHTLGALVPGSILAHGVHLSAVQVSKAAALGCWIVQNPRSNRGNRVGYPHGLKASGRVALGTDGYRSDMSEELQALFEIGAEHHENPRTLGARLLGSQTLAAEVLGVPFPARPADATDKPIGYAWTTRDACTAQLTVDGRVIVEDGQLRTADIETIRAEAREEAARLWRRMMSEDAP